MLYAAHNVIETIAVLVITPRGCRKFLAITATAFFGHLFAGNNVGPQEPKSAFVIIAALGQLLGQQLFKYRLKAV